MEHELTKYEYMMLNDRCAVCHWPASRKGRTVEVHHIQGGPARKDVPLNWLVVCRRCHTCIHQKLPVFGELSKGAILRAKLEADGFVDEKGLANLRNRQALSYTIAEIPQVFLDERERNGGDNWP